MSKPTQLPNNPNFSSGPCSKRPGWTFAALADAKVGRSHRSKPGRAALKEVIERSTAILGLPEGWRLGIVPASDTGAVEMVLWSMLGARGVDMLAWESFGSGWVTDVQKQLKLEDVRVFTGAYGSLPDLSAVDFDRDVVFTWNGTTGGVCLADGDWIPDDREGLTICDATSAVFAMEVPFAKLDVVTWSWQKALGGEGAHGMLALSPRAVARLESFTPDRPLPKIFRMTKGGKITEGIWVGDTINTPSMLCVADANDSLRWAASVGGLPGLIGRSQANLAAVAAWVEGNPRFSFLAGDPAIRSSTSICLVFSHPDVVGLPLADRAAFAKKLSGLVDAEGAGYDLNHYRDAPPGVRIWGGATVETSDIEALLPWLDWAHDQVLAG